MNGTSNTSTLPPQVDTPQRPHTRQDFQEGEAAGRISFARHESLPNLPGGAFGVGYLYGFHRAQHESNAGTRAPAKPRR